MRSQTSTEYLIISAVVILIAVLVIGVLGGIPGIGGRMSESEARLTLSTLPVGISDYAAFDDYYSMKVSNNQVNAIEVTRIIVGGNGCTLIDSLENQSLVQSITLRSGESKAIYCFGAELRSGGEDVQDSIMVKYTDKKTGARYTIQDNDYRLIDEVSAVSEEDFIAHSINFSIDNRLSTIVAHEGWLYFSAQDSSGGRELWRTDGTTTEQVADLYAGSFNSGVGSLASHSDGWLYFRANNGSFGLELWRTDGTTTEQVADLYAGSFNSGVGSLASHSDGWLYFRANNGSFGLELWRTDGSTIELVEDIYSGSSSSSPSSLTSHNDGYVYFRADDGSAGAELHRTDGSITELVADVRSGSSSSSISYISSSSDGWVYFQANDGSSGSEVWRSDGTGAELFADINSGSGSSSPSSIVSHSDGWVYFIANDGVSDYELWRSDGTTNEQLSNIVDGDGAYIYSSPHLISFGNYVYHYGFNGTDTNIVRYNSQTDQFENITRANSVEGSNGGMIGVFSIADMPLLMDGSIVFYILEGNGGVGFSNHSFLRIIN